MSKKIIGIISDFGYTNFGNKLQNYSLIKTFEGFGFSVKNIIYIKKYRNILEKTLFDLYYKLKRTATCPKRELCIKKASKKYENRLFLYSYTKGDKKRINSFHTVIFGSDQVWNLNYHSDKEFVLGQFEISDEKFRKISYAASIGTTEIPNQYKPLFYRNLRSFYRISCREESGTKCIKDLGFNCVTTLDPTLLLDAKDWNDAIARFSSRKIKNKDYVLLYFLKNATAKSQILTECKKEEVQDIDLMDESSPFYVSNQFDFINLIKNARHIYTDSFHASVFSILFGKDFNVYPRTDNPKTDKMFARIVNLFDLFGIKIDLSLKNEFHSSDFINLSKFNSLKNDSIQFLKDSIIE